MPRARRENEGIPRRVLARDVLRDASALVYREAMFQSYYGVKRGGWLPETKGPGEFRSFMRQSAIIMKGLLCLFLAGTAVAAALGTTKASFPGVSPAVAMAVVAGVSLLALVLVITVMAMDMVTGFVAARAVHTLVLLPLSRQEVATTALLAFLRIFDAPLAVGIMAFAVSHVILTRSIAGAFAYIVGVATAEAFAVVLALALAELFYAKVLNQNGSKLKNVARILYLLMSIMPGIGMYFLFSYQVQASRAILAAMAESPSLAGVLHLVYPVSFGYLIAAASGADGVAPGVAAASCVACAAYAGLAAWGLAWAGRRLRTRALGGVVGTCLDKSRARSGAGRGSFKLRLVAPWLGVLIKDLRLVFRSPSEAALLLMPAGAIIPWAVMLGSAGRLPSAGPIGVVSLVGAMAVTTVPALFNVEAVGQAYTMTLPVEPRWTLVAKAGVATTTYAVSIIVLLAVAAVAGLADVGDAIPLCASVVLPTAAGSLVTGSALIRTTGRLERGCAGGGGRPSGARVSPFMSPGRYLKALAAGCVVVALPHLAARVGQAVFGLSFFPVHFTAGLLEFSAVAVAILSPRRRAARPVSTGTWSTGT